MKKVLVVEDDQWLGDSYERILRPHFLVVRASSAEEAMRSVEDEKIDVVLADVMLEGHTVFALLHELQTYDDTKQLPVVLCSNLDQAVLQAANVRQYGVCRVLDKALIVPTELVDAVKEYAP